MWKDAYFCFFFVANLNIVSTSNECLLWAWVNLYTYLFILNIYDKLHHSNNLNNSYFETKITLWLFIKRIYFDNGFSIFINVKCKIKLHFTIQPKLPWTIEISLRSCYAIIRVHFAITKVPIFHQNKASVFNYNELI